ncbi:hypothetical protein ACLMJK_009104 [Lecanora helva]
MSANAKIALITGANSGIGLATAKILACAPTNPPYHIIMASRTPSKGATAIDSIKSSSNLHGSLSALQLDVTDESSIEAAAKKVEADFGRLDALINNAGVATKAPTFKEQLQTDFNTNVVGTAMVTQAFLPLLMKSQKPYLIHVSSGLGSVSQAADKSASNYSAAFPAYRASKAALNMLMTQDWKELEGKGVKVFAFCPGLVESNLRGTGEMERSAGGRAGDPDVSGKTVLKMLEGERDADVGKFVHKDGVYGW